MGLKSQLSTLEMGDGASPEVFAAIEKVTSISGPDGSANLIDITHLTSTGKEYLQGLADFGKIQLDINFTGAVTQMLLRTKYATQANAANYKLKIPTGTGTFHSFNFAAIVTSWSLAAKTDDKVALTVPLQISGSVTYVAPA
jgi:predicted secreted protein